MTELHRFDDAVQDHRRAESRSQSQEQHPSAPVAAESLHRRIVDDPYRQAECRSKIEPRPTSSEIVRLSDGTAVENRSGKADRYHVVGPILRKFLDVGDHLPCCHFWPGNDLPLLPLAGGKYFDVSPTDIDG